MTSPLRRLLQRQHLGQLGDLGVEALQHGVLAGDLAGEQELDEREDRQEEDEDEQQVGEDVDEAGQYSARPMTAACGPWPSAILPAGRLQRLGDRLEQRLHLALLLGLGLDPASDHLLLAAHVLDEALDALGEVGHGGGGALGRPIAGCAAGAVAAFLDGARQALDRDAEVLRGGPGAAAALDQVGIEVGDRRQPVLEVVVEHALRLAGLQVEEAEDERAGEAEQRGREGDAHAGERRRRGRPSDPRR